MCLRNYKITSTIIQFIHKHYIQCIYSYAPMQKNICSTFLFQILLKALVIQMRCEYDFDPRDGGVRLWCE